MPSIAENVARLDACELTELLSELSDEDCENLLYDWEFWAREKQKPPPGDWFCWLVTAGRGFGKTRLGAEWVRSSVEGASPLVAPAGAPERIALVSQTIADGRDVMVEGESGLLLVSRPDHRPKFEISRRRMVWPNGIVAHLYSSEEPDQLRGPQHGIAWCDELAKWGAPEASWSNLMLGLRLGSRPRVVVTTTPRPIALLKALVSDPTTVVTAGSTFENAAHLPPTFVDQVSRLYGGTRLGRQELDGLILEDVPGALWTDEMIDTARVSKAPLLRRVIVAIDPPVSHGEAANLCGIIVAGVALDDHFYVLADKSCQGLRPHQWMHRALAAYQEFEADRLVAEVNQGGDLIEALLRQEAPDVAYRAVRASRGKITRAEPVAALYERGLVHHVGCFKALEAQLRSYTGDVADGSPDRLDALVWAISDLARGLDRNPRVRAL